MKNYIINTSVSCRLRLSLGKHCYWQNLALCMRTQSTTGTLRWNLNSQNCCNDLPHLQKVLRILYLVWSTSDVDYTVRSSRLQLINGYLCSGFHSDLLDSHASLANNGSGKLREKRGTLVTLYGELPVCSCMLRSMLQYVFTILRHTINNCLQNSMYLITVLPT
jgi:hypothetical protein